MVIVVAVLAFVVIYQQFVIHRLYDKLLAKAGVSPLGPVIQMAPPTPPEKPDVRKKLFSVKVDA